MSFTIVKFDNNQLNIIMTLTEFKKEYQDLILEMETRMNEPENDRFIIDDGVYNPEKYFSNEIRLAWMLKEPYDEEDGTGGGWSYLSMFEGDDLYESTFKKGHRTTWHPIIYTSHSILNGFPKWKDIDYLSNDSSIITVIREVAFMNAQKLPAKGVTRTNMNDIIESISKHGDLLKRQKELLNPNVLIFANTFDLYRDLLELNDIVLEKNGSCEYVAHDGKLYISAFHPAQTQVSGENYMNDIVEVVRKWLNK